MIDPELTPREQLYVGVQQLSKHARAEQFNAEIRALLACARDDAGNHEQAFKDMSDLAVRMMSGAK